MSIFFIRMKVFYLFYSTNAQNMAARKVQNKLKRTKQNTQDSIKACQTQLLSFVNLFEQLYLSWTDSDSIKALLDQTINLTFVNSVIYDTF